MVIKNLKLTIFNLIYRSKNGPSRRLIGNNSYRKYEQQVHSTWTPAEREVLVKMMVRHLGFNPIKTELKYLLPSLTV